MENCLFWLLPVTLAPINEVTLIETEKARVKVDELLLPVVQFCWLRLGFGPIDGGTKREEMHSALPYPHYVKPPCH